MKRKWREQEGFTLIEMLIVVAIIAILIAVSIPLVGNALERAREATDMANERAAKAEVLIAYMTGAEVLSNSGGINMQPYKPDEVYAYNNVTGSLQMVVGTSVPVEPYGQCKDCKGKIIFVKFNEQEMKVEIQWHSGEHDGRPNKNEGGFTPNGHLK